MVFIRGKLNRKATTKGKDQGFTLVEVMVVAAILVLLAGVAVPQLFKSFEDARKQKLEVDAKQIQVVKDRAILEARLQGRTLANTGKWEVMTPAVLSATYGLTVTVTEGVKFSYMYVTAEQSTITKAAYSVVMVEYGTPAQVYYTDSGKWSATK